MYKQIAENKRRTVFIIMGFVLMIGVIAALFAWCYRDPWIAVWTVVAALIYALIQYYCAGNIAMAMTGAKEITKKENPRLYNIVESLMHSQRGVILNMRRWRRLLGSWIL